MPWTIVSVSTGLFDSRLTQWSIHVILSGSEVADAYLSSQSMARMAHLRGYLHKHNWLVPLDQYYTPILRPDAVP